MDDVHITEWFNLLGCDQLKGRNIILDGIINTKELRETLVETSNRISEWKFLCENRNSRYLKEMQKQIDRIDNHEANILFEGMKNANKQS